MTVREAAAIDAAAIRGLVAVVDGGNPFCVRAPDELPEWLDDRDELSMPTGRHTAVLLAERPDGPKGYAAIRPGRYRRNADTATLEIGVRPERMGCGVGSTLMRAAEQWAVDRGLRRLGYAVRVDHERAIALGDKFRYVHEGLCRETVRGDGRWHDEVRMGKLLIADGGEMCAPLLLEAPSLPADADRVAIRPLTVADAPAHHAFDRQMRCETSFVMRAPDEAAATPDATRAFLAAEVGRPDRFRAAAFIDGRIVGTIGGQAGPGAGRRADITLGMAVLRAYWAAGIGTRLMESLEAWARGRGGHRLSLEVFAHNVRGRRFYEARGFDVEAVARRGAVVDGCYADMVAMGRILT
ncbi:MAG: GNAT family N-acetyltransferase [Inquilinaceae bacterium]